jgi:preprotein translocase subunit SecF
MIIVKHRTVFFIITGLIILVSFASTFIWGLKLSTDFTGGTLVEVTYPEGRPASGDLSASLNSAGYSGYSLREAGEKDYILRSPELTEAERNALPAALSIGSTTQASITQYTQVGPVIGTELRRKAFISVSLVLLCILLFIAFAFRKVSQPVSSWVYGAIALITLLHDVVVPVGFFAALGHFAGAEVDTLFVTAVLTVLGFSVHDTIVVFDRVRENLAINKERGRKEPFEETAGRALNQTFVRSVNTSLTVLITLLILFFLGPASTRDFALTLLVGIIAGTYSSIALATPLLVVSERWFARRK